MRTIARAAAAIMATTIVIGASAASANAQSQTIKDKSSDVIRYADIDDQQGVVLNYAESLASGVDMRSLRVKHTKKSVSINLKFADLGAETLVYLIVRTDGKRNPSRMLINLDKKSGLVMNMRGDKRCLAPLTTRLGKSGSISAVIERSCLGTPAKIKVSAAASNGQVLDDGAAYLADAFFSPSSVRTDSWTKWLKAG